MTTSSKYCPQCEHPWTEHIEGQPCPTNSEIAGRVMRPSTKLKMMRCAALPIERIVAAAIQVEGVTVSLPLPALHGQVLHAALNMHLPDHMVTPACQGFLTSTGRFVNRVQAKQIAHMAGQPQLRPESERTKDLYSEDLW